MFDLSIDRPVHYKPIKANSDFNSSYVEYESIGDKDKKLRIKEFLDIIRPYLSNQIKWSWNSKRMENSINNGN